MKNIYELKWTTYTLLYRNLQKSCALVIIQIVEYGGDIFRKYRLLILYVIENVI